jgi:hypothetical protein
MRFLMLSLIMVFVFSGPAHSQVRFVADANAGYHWFGVMGSGPGVDASAGLRVGSGAEIALRGEYWFPQTVEWEGASEPPPDFSGSWSEYGLTIEFRYRFLPARAHGPLVGLNIGKQWFRSPYDWTEGDITYGAQLGYEYWINPNVGFVGSLYGSLGDRPELDKNRLAIRIGAKFST